MHAIALIRPLQARLKGAAGGVEAFKEIVRRVGKLDKVDDKPFVVLKPALGGPA